MCRSRLTRCRTPPRSESPEKALAATRSGRRCRGTAPRATASPRVSLGCPSERKDVDVAAQTADPQSMLSALSPLDRTAEDEPGAAAWGNGEGACRWGGAVLRAAEPGATPSPSISTWARRRRRSASSEAGFCSPAMAITKSSPDACRSRRQKAWCFSSRSCDRRLQADALEVADRHRMCRSRLASVPACYVKRDNAHESGPHNPLQAAALSVATAELPRPDQPDEPGRRTMARRATRAMAA